jgi:membrane carboxypeptidase/penicillin-binding protein PbpC
MSSAAVKTGTSSNYRDAWTVTYSSKNLVGVRVGTAGLSPDEPIERLPGSLAVVATGTTITIDATL